MGRNFYVSGWRDGDPRGGRDAWVDTEMQMREEGNRHPGSDSLPVEHRPIMEPEFMPDRNGKVVKNPRFGLQAVDRLTGKPRTRPVRKDSALGFASEDFHYAGDRIVTLNEEVEFKGGKATGRILHHFQRVDDQGRSLGSYEQAWEKDERKEGRMRSAGKARRYYSF